MFGAAAGIVVAYGGTVQNPHLTFGQPNAFVPLEATPSVPMLLFALSISTLTGIVFGVAPAWLAVRADPMNALRVASRSAGGHRQRAQNALVTLEAAVSVVLLSAAAMLGLSLRNLERQDFGFEVSGRYLVTINTMLSGLKQEQLLPVLQQIQDGVRRIPGVNVYFNPIQNLRIGGRVSKSRFQYVMKSVSAGQLQEYSDKLMGLMRPDPAFRDVTSDAQLKGLQAQIDIDRDKANTLGVNIQDIRTALYSTFGER